MLGCNLLHQLAALLPRGYSTNATEAVQALSPEVLILDLRDEAAYAQAHLLGAVSYPSRLLSHAHNCFSRQILSFCNADPARVIVLCDADERIAVPASVFFYQKGVNNVYMVTGAPHAN